MKRCFSLLLALLMVVSLAACGGRASTPAQEPAIEEKPIAELDPNTVIAEVESAVFNTRLEELLELVHPNVLTSVLSTAELSEEELHEMIAELNADLTDALSMFHRLNGSYELRVTNEKKLDGDELDEVRDTYSQCMVDVRAATTLETEFVLLTNGKESYRDTFRITMIEIDGQWYVEVFGLMEYFGLDL